MDAIEFTEIPGYPVVSTDVVKDAYNTALADAVREIEASWRIKSAMGFNGMAQRNMVKQHCKIIEKLKK